MAFLGLNLYFGYKFNCFGKNRYGLKNVILRPDPDPELWLVLRILEILLWIRIRGSIPLTN